MSPPTRPHCATPLALTAFLFVAGCVPLLEPTGQPCPCVEGYTCDPTGHCILASPDAGLALPPAGPPGDASADPRSPSAALPPLPGRDAGPADTSVLDAGPWDCIPCDTGRSCFEGCKLSFVDLKTWYDATCAVMARGLVACWGEGYGDVPQVIPGISDAIEVAMGHQQGCAIRRAGAVSCWSPTEARAGSVRSVPFDGPVTSLRTSSSHTCGLLSDGSVQCMGSNRRGEFGDTGPDSLGAPRSVSLNPQIDDATTLFGAPDVTCLVHGAQRDYVSCFGPGLPTPITATQLGAVRLVDPAIGGVVTADSIYYLQRDQGLFLFKGTSSEVTAISRDCRVFRGSEVDCRGGNPEWGYSTRDVFGVIQQNAQDFILTSSTTLRVATGSWHTCVLGADGQIRCLGHDHQGQVAVDEPKPLTGAQTLSGVAAEDGLIAGPGAACALSDGELVCWGNNANHRGHLGRWGGALSPRPLSVPTGHLVAGTFLWGPNTLNRGLAVLTETSSASEVMVYGPVSLAGLPEFSTPSQPRTVDYLRGAVTIEGGRDELCARMPDATVRCVLPESSQVLGAFEGATNLALEPQGNYRLAVVGGEIRCLPKWGTCPSQLDGLQQVVEVVTGNNHGLARLSNGQVLRFGDHSRLGATPPQLVPQVTGAVSVSAGAEHACVVEAQGRTHCWGDNAARQSNFGDPAAFVPPSSPSTLSEGYLQVASGDEFTCGRKWKAGGVECWGRTDACQLGSCPGLLYESLTVISPPSR